MLDSPAYFNNSPGILSRPGDFPSLSFLTSIQFNSIHVYLGTWPNINFTKFIMYNPIHNIIKHSKQHIRIQNTHVPDTPIFSILHSILILPL